MAYTIGSTINSNFHGQPIPKVHDSFWTHASDVPLLNESIRVPGQRVNVVSCDLKRGPTRNQSLPGGFLLGGQGVQFALFGLTFRVLPVAHTFRQGLLLSLVTMERCPCDI
jgi:hypothetical protein